MMDRSIRWLLATALLVPAAAQAAPVAVLVRDAGEQDAEGALLVDLRLLNEGDEPQSFALPDRIEARVERSGDIRTVWLERARDVADHVIIAPRGFERARYRLAARDGQSLDLARLSIPAWNVSQIAMIPRPAAPASHLAEAHTPAPVPPVRAPARTRPPSDRRVGNALRANLSGYEPIYAVYGPDVDFH
mgnify:FL=1